MGPWLALNLKQGKGMHCEVLFLFRIISMNTRYLRVKPDWEIIGPRWGLTRYTAFVLYGFKENIKNLVFEFINHKRSFE